MVDKDTVTLSDNPIVLGYDVEVCVFVCVCVHACVLLVHTCMHMHPCVCTFSGNLCNLLHTSVM